MILRLRTTNDGGMTSPAEAIEAKIIVGGPRTHRGWGGNAGVPGQQSDSQQPAGSWKGH